MGLPRGPAGRSLWIKRVERQEKDRPMKTPDLFRRLRYASRRRLPPALVVAAVLVPISAGLPVTDMGGAARAAETTRTAAAMPAPPVPTPQALAVVASAGPVPMNCLGAACEIELTTLCLEPERASPGRGVAYRPHDGIGGFAVSATLRSGETVSLDPAQSLRYEALRGHSAVLAQIDPDSVRALGIKSAVLTVGDRATLLPILSGDPADRHTPQEIATVTGDHRALAASVLTGEAASLAATRITGRMINALPPGRRIPAAAVGGSGLSGAKDVESARAAAREAAAAEGAAGDAGLAIAEEALSRCATFGFSTVRDCLGAMHDNFIGQLNNRYWDALKPVF